MKATIFVLALLFHSLFSRGQFLKIDGKTVNPSNQSQQFVYKLQVEAHSVTGDIEQESDDRNDWCAYLTVSIIGKDGDVLGTFNTEPYRLTRGTFDTHAATHKVSVNWKMERCNQSDHFLISINNSCELPQPIPVTKSICRTSKVPEGWVIIAINSGEIINGKKCDDFCNNGYTIQDLSSWQKAIRIIEGTIIPNGWRVQDNSEDKIHPACGGEFKRMIITR